MSERCMMKAKFNPWLLFSLLLMIMAAPGPPAAAGNNASLPQEFTNDLGMQFVLIPAGGFVMGSPPQEPFRDGGGGEKQHRVFISQPFYMQTTEVTLKQWWALMGKQLFGRRKGPDNLPVTAVSWYDANEFIAELNARGKHTYRLPTEAQWEYACRAGTDTAYSWGREIDCSRAMYANNPGKAEACVADHQSQGLEIGRPAPVKTYAANPWGLYDMHGNVWEWCLDIYDDYPTQPVTDPEGPASGTNRVRRSGSWFKYGFQCRCANRAYAHPAARMETTGFRIIRMVAP